MTERSTARALLEKSSPVEKEMIYQGKTIALRTELLKIPNKRPHRSDIVVHPGAIVIVPEIKEGHILLVKQWRRAVGQITYELPAGTLEEKEPPLECAQRELQEETGYKAGKMTPMGGFFSAPGFCTEFLYLFIAKDLVESSLPPDEDEAIDVISMTLEKALGMIDDFTICDAKTIAGILRYDRWLKSTR